MIYSHFFGPVGVKRKRATFGQFSTAVKEAATPLMIPIIIMGGILTGQFTPTEAGIIAVAYIVFVAIPLLNFRHLRHMPRDMAMTGLLYSIPLITIGAASAFGWMLAYLRGPAVVSEWIANAAGGDPFMILLLLTLLFVIVGDFIDDDDAPCIRSDFSDRLERAAVILAVSRRLHDHRAPDAEPASHLLICGHGRIRRYEFRGRRRWIASVVDVHVGVAGAWRRLELRDEGAVDRGHGKHLGTDITGAVRVGEAADRGR
jgi:hypothetical protein